MIERIHHVNMDCTTDEQGGFEIQIDAMEMLNQEGNIEEIVLEIP